MNSKRERRDFAVAVFILASAFAMSFGYIVATSGVFVPNVEAWGAK